MANTIKLKTTTGEQVEFVEEIIGSGGMKDVYFTPDKKSVVAFYRDKQDFTARERLDNIVNKYNPTINDSFSEYWKNIYCWPTHIVESNGKLGVVCPTYPDYFFFKDCKFPSKGTEKEGKWFSSASLRKMLDVTDRGDWFSYFRINILISRGVRRLHTAGLSHSDLSYKNVLISPGTGNAAIIDIDSLVVPGKYPPDVAGTPDFIAPEVLRTLSLPRDNKDKKLPSRYTDLHALAVLIYMYLLYRHPLRGGKFHDADSEKDEMMMMGEKALFIENASDKSNYPKEMDARFMPWADPAQRPYTLCGPYLKNLFDRAFIEGLHNPSKRPSAMEWEDALIRTVDLLQPCGNSNCEQKWFVFDNKNKPKCPFCGWQFKGLLPVLDFYSEIRKGQYGSDNHRLMVYNNQYLYPWHVNKSVIPNEKLSAEQKKPLGYFVFHQGKWILVNQKLPQLRDISDEKDIPINSAVELNNGKKLLMSNESGGRVVYIQMVHAL